MASYFKALTRQHRSWFDKEGASHNYRAWQSAAAMLPDSDLRGKIALARRPDSRYRLAEPWALDVPRSGPCALWKSVEDAVAETELPCRLFRAEPCGPAIEENERRAIFSAAKIVSLLPTPPWLQLANSFAASIPRVKFLSAQGEPDPTWRLFETYREAEMAAEGQPVEDRYRMETSFEPPARSEAVRAIGSSVRVTTRRAIGWVAEAWEQRIGGLKSRLLYHAADPERDIEWVPTPQAAAVRSAGFGAECDAGDDAAMLAMRLACDGLDVSRDRAEQSWRVWRLGYGLFARAGEILLVYRRLV
jgi:hypothetical protein